MIDVLKGKAVDAVWVVCPINLGITEGAISHSEPIDPSAVRPGKQSTLIVPDQMPEGLVSACVVCCEHTTIPLFQHVQTRTGDIQNVPLIVEKVQVGRRWIKIDCFEGVGILIVSKEATGLRCCPQSP